MGGVAALHNIYTINNKEIKYLKPNDATFKFGTGNMGGAFLITTKNK